MDKNLVGALVFALIGACLLAPGVYQIVSTAKRHMGQDTARGVVVEIRVRPAVKTGGTELSTPVFRFTAGDGREHTVAGSRGYSRAPFSVGDEVTVRYSRANPEDAAIDTFFEVWGLGVLLSAFGAVFLLAALLAHQRLR